MTTNQGITMKTELIDGYIQRIDSIVSTNNYEAAEDLQSEIISVFYSEISEFAAQLDTYHLYDDNHQVDYIGNLIKIRAKLLNHKANIYLGIFSSGNGSGVTVNQSVTQDASTSVSITLNSTVSSINQLPEQVLSEEEKDILNGKLAGLSAETDRERRWEKVKDALKWVAEKSIEVGTAALPYIVKILEAKE